MQVFMVQNSNMDHCILTSLVHRHFREMCGERQGEGEWQCTVDYSQTSAVASVQCIIGVSSPLIIGVAFLLIIQCLISSHYLVSRLLSLDLSTYAQRGLRYLVCKCVCRSVCLSVCLLPRFLRLDNKTVIPMGLSLHWLHFYKGRFSCNYILCLEVVA